MLRGSQEPENTSVFSTSSFKSVINELLVKTTRNDVSDFDFATVRVGKKRNLIEIDVMTIDDKPYTAQISEIEAYKLICRKALKLDKGIIYATKISWAGHPLVKIRLRETCCLKTSNTTNKTSMNMGMRSLESSFVKPAV